MFYVYFENDLGVEELVLATVNETEAAETAIRLGGWVEAH